LTVCENGFGKRTPVSEYTPHHRGGQGMINIKTTVRNGGVVAVASVTDDDQILLATRDGIMMRINVKDVSEIGRNTQGVRIITLKSADDSVVGMAKLASEKKEESI
jgi:DNA gyrase subunit A